MEPVDTPACFGDWLSSRRRALDLTQAELAQRAGCSTAGLRKIEAGERRPSKELAALLARALEIAPDRQETFIRAARGELNIERLGAPAIRRSPERPSSPPATLTLPVSSTPFVGRAGELYTLGDLLNDRDCRLLTLIGPGGIGKTRLAVEVAAAAAGRFTGGACFVPLAGVSAAVLLVPTVADALGYVFQGQVEARLQLLNYLRAKQILLVLDNAEHLLEGVDLFAEIIGRAPGVKLLVTSRERLNLRGEWVYEIQGLPVPAEDETEGVETYSSVALFVQSARRARTGFELRPADRSCVARICRLLEGMPLGIELAAAWVFALSPCEIARQIEQSLDFLETSLRDVPERQRSLRAAFDHSWGLLSDDERGVLQRLAVFGGGFGRKAAEQVAGASLASLLALASKSLVRSRETGRYELHEVVRQYALGHLVQSAEWDDTRDRHSRYYLELLASRERDLKGPAQADAMRQLTEEISNVRAAWAWAVMCEAFELIGSAVRGHGWMCEAGGRLREGVDELDFVLDALRGRELHALEQRVLARALAQQGLLRFRQGQFDAAQALFNESIALARSLGDPALLVDALVFSSIILHLCGDYDRAMERVLEGRACASQAGERWFAIYAHFNEGYIASLTGRVEEGYELMRRSLSAWRATADPHTIALGLNFISPVAIQLGRYEEAQTNLEESIELCEGTGNRWGLGTAHRFLGQAMLAQGRTGEARQHIHRSLELFKDMVIGWDVIVAACGLGQCAAADGDLTEAERQFRDGLRGAMEAGTFGLALDVLVELAALRLRAGQPAAARRLAAAVLSHRASTWMARQQAAELCAAADAELAALSSPPADAEPVWTLAEAVAWLMNNEPQRL